ncbi:MULTISPECIES: UvrD-helicase domain-containing protein [Rhizobium]|uniref:UvrD-helicase domain-containing protein n=1 Tax=Rhizobium phaseoli TaxID=396 RepID=UPI000A1C045A|nr:UvrD-helicase domain-containing protein [Rhizobium phaseoli]ARM16078.1 DNA helicase UvrD-like protein [Rhizobium phaseoli Brasil 5]
MTDDEIARSEAEARQQAVIEHKGECYVVACPGAGKTLTLVRRAIAISATLETRQGIAILSFTNSAVDEFKEKHGSEANTSPLGFPHFVGTFDAFLNHFIVMPFGIPGCADRPTIVDRWEGIMIPHGQSGVAAPPIPLHHFDGETGLLAANRHSSLAPAQAAVRSHYEAAAKRRLDRLYRKAMLAATAARKAAIEFLKENPARAKALGEAIAARFVEIIVDEAQDCNDDDVFVLEWLRTHGARLVVVCDPDQAIYGFRNGSSANFASFVGKLPSLVMNGNFRSSKTICAAAATMRAASRGTPDLAVGIDRDFSAVIHVVPYKDSPASKATVGAKFSELLDTSKLIKENSMVLAHKRKLAARISGNLPQANVKSDGLRRLAGAVADYHRPATSPRERSHTIRSTVRLLMEMEGHDEDEVSTLRSMTENQEPMREYHRKAVMLLEHLPPRFTGTITIDTWLTMARAEILRLTGTKVAWKPRKTDWANPLTTSSGSVSNLPYATIHEAKGRAYDAVCVVIDGSSENVIEHWTQRASATSEALRVLYVGLTRARKLAVLAIPENQVELAAEVLKASSVPHQLWTAPRKAAANKRSSKRLEETTP